MDKQRETPPGLPNIREWRENVECPSHERPGGRGSSGTADQRDRLDSSSTGTRRIQGGDSLSVASASLPPLENGPSNGSSAPSVAASTVSTAPSELDEIKRFCLQGKTLTEIASALSATENYVELYIERLILLGELSRRDKPGEGLSHRIGRKNYRWTSIDFDRLELLVKEPTLLSEIALRFNRPERSITWGINKLKKEGRITHEQYYKFKALPFKNRARVDMTPSKVDRIRHMVTSGNENRDIAADIGCTVSMIRSAMTRFSISRKKGRKREHDNGVSTAANEASTNFATSDHQDLVLHPQCNNQSEETSAGMNVFSDHRSSQSGWSKERTTNAMLPNGPTAPRQQSQAAAREQPPQPLGHASPGQSASACAHNLPPANTSQQADPGMYATDPSERLWDSRAWFRVIVHVAKGETFEAISQLTGIPVMVLLHNWALYTAPNRIHLSRWRLIDINRRCLMASKRPFCSNERVLELFPFSSYLGTSAGRRISRMTNVDFGAPPRPTPSSFQMPISNHRYAGVASHVAGSSSSMLGYHPSHPTDFTIPANAMALTGLPFVVQPQDVFRFDGRTATWWYVPYQATRSTGFAPT